MAERDVRAQKVLSVVKPVLAAIVGISGKDIPWGKSGLPARAQVEALLREGGDGAAGSGGQGGHGSNGVAGGIPGGTPVGRLLRGYYSTLSSLRNQAAGDIRWGKGDIPELEHMDSTLAGLYAFISEHVLGYESRQGDSDEG